MLVYHGSEMCSPLIYLADAVGYWDEFTFHVLEKAVVLLRWGNFDTTCVDSHGSTVLHVILRCKRLDMGVIAGLRPCKEPRELLKWFIAAGADVYALSSDGRSASRVARNYGRDREWTEALEACGFNSKDVVRQTMPRHIPYIGPRQTTKLSLEKCYHTWDEERWEKRMGTGKFHFANVERYSESEMESEDERSYPKHDSKTEDVDSEIEKVESARQEQIELERENALKIERQQKSAGGVVARPAQQLNEPQLCCCSEETSAVVTERMSSVDDIPTTTKERHCHPDEHTISDCEDCDGIDLDSSTNVGFTAYIPTVLTNNGATSSNPSPCKSGYRQSQQVNGPVITPLLHSPIAPVHCSNSITPIVANMSENQPYNDQLGAMAWQYDPLLNEEAESTTGSWRFGALEPGRTLEERSLNAGNFELDSVLEDAFRTEFDDCLADDEEEL
jgi:hypothetical protein